jgi:3',5'-nucleoside bisphosphate phosphatase
MRVGLHNHTCFSDGRLSPGELIAQAEKLAYERFAITDHNLLSGWQSVGTLPSWVVPGIELSALTENGTEIHLLGLDVQPKADLLAHSQYFTEAYSDLWQEGVFIVTGDMELAALARNPLTRTEAVDQICERAGAKEAVRAWSIGHRHLYTDRLRSKMPFWKDAIALLHRSQATVGLAHPQRYPSLPDMAAILDTVDAVEVIHPTHSLEQQHHWSQEAVQRDKQLWGSHDFHGWSGEQADGLLEPIQLEIETLCSR